MSLRFVKLVYMTKNPSLRVASRLRFVPSLEPVASLSVVPQSAIPSWVRHSLRLLLPTREVPVPAVQLVFAFDSVPSPVHPQ